MNLEEVIKSGLMNYQDDLYIIEVVEMNLEEVGAAEPKFAGMTFTIVNYKSNAKAKATTTTAAANGRKRAPAKKAPATQKLITDVLKPVIESPEKKVRKIREFPFNKKSGSMLGSGDSSSISSNLESEMNAVPIAVSKPKRERKAPAKVTYIESDSEEEELELSEESEESDFEEDDDY